MNNTSRVVDSLGYVYRASQMYNSTLKLPVHIIVFYGIAYGLIFLSAVIGNLMVVTVVARTPRMHTVTNLFIANLAAADILVAVLCIPMTFLDNIYYGWPFGEFLCKMTPYIQGVSVCASVYNLAAIAIDRLVAICFHPRWRIMKRGALVIFCLIWLFSVTLMIPWAIYASHYLWQEQLITNITATTTATTTIRNSTGSSSSATTSITINSLYLCSQVWPDFDSQRAYFVGAIVVGTYLLPLAVIFLCYILIAWRVWHRKAPGVAMGNGIIKRCKLNVVKMLITVVLMFALSWLPLHVLFLVLYFNPPADQTVRKKIQNIGVPLAQWLELSNSGMNAFIYSFFSGNFRRGFLHLWYCLTRRKKAQTGNYASQRMTRTASEDSAMLARYSVQRSVQRELSNGSRAFRLTNRLNYNDCYLDTVPRSSVIDMSNWSFGRTEERYTNKDQAFV